MFAWLWNYLSGYVMISVEGLSLEKFLNLAAQGKIKLWDVRRASYTKLTACVSRAGFHRLHGCLRELRNARVHIEIKHGAPFKLSFLRFRKALVLGALLFLAALIGAGMFIWDVKVEGNMRVSEEVVLAAVAKRGAERFAQRQKLDMLAIASAAIAADERIAWAGAKLRGTQLIIEVVESAQEPRMLDKDSPADIVAMKDAVVGEITVLEGVAQVEENKAVRAGDILISGTILHEGQPPRRVRARGEIMGRVWYESSARIGSHRIVPKRTGKEQMVTAISIVGWEVPVSKTEAYAKLEREPIVYERLTSLFLPVYYTREKQYELEETKEPLTQEEMTAATREMAMCRLMELVAPSSTITGITTKFTPLEDSLLCELFAEAEEPVGVVKEIGGGQLEQPEETEDAWTVP